MEELNEKEIYYISKYNTYYKGYNETLGGQNHQHQQILTNNQIQEIIDLLQHSDLSQQQIASRFDISQCRISQINTGDAFKQDNLSYPLRKKNVHRCIDCGKIIS